MENKIEVQITNNEIQKLSKGSIDDALLQVIANAIDADATEVKIYLHYEEQGINNDELSVPVLSKIIISDNGYGINSEKVKDYFSQYGSSWKQGKFRPDGRRYNGEKGTARFKYLTLGSLVEWQTTHIKGESNFSYSMTLRYESPKSIPITNCTSSNDPIGTQVTISKLSEKGSTLKDDYVKSIVLQGFGLYIKNSLGKFKVYLNDEEINPDSYIDKTQEGFFNLDINDENYLFRYQFIAWIKGFEFKNHKHAFLYDHEGNYKNIIPSGTQASNYLPYHTVFIFSDYYNKFDSYSDSFHEVTDRLRKSYRTQLTEFLLKVKKTRTQAEFKGFKTQIYYPFDSNLSSDVEKAERNIFDLCAYSILDNDPKLLSDKNHSLLLLFKLLKKIIEKDENIVANLSEIIDLDDKHASLLKSACKSIKLPKLIAHYNELQQKQIFLDVLDTLVHDDFYKEHLKERIQLHKIIEKELWIFGDELDYNLGTSDQCLTKVLEKNLKVQDLLPEDIEKIEKEISDNKNDIDSCLRKIPDLYLWRKYEDSRNRSVKNLIIELKAPKVNLSPALIKQGQNVYNGILSAKGLNINKENQWEYIYVSSDITPSMEGLFQGDPSLQIISNFQNGNYVISCKKWSQVIQSARFKLIERKKGLEIEISQEQKQDLLQSYLDKVDFISNKVLST